MLLMGGAVIFLILAGILLCVSAVVLMIVAWDRHRKKSNTETDLNETEEPK